MYDDGPRLKSIYDAIYFGNHLRLHVAWFILLTFSVLVVLRWSLILPKLASMVMKSRNRIISLVYLLYDKHIEVCGVLYGITLLFPPCYLTQYDYPAFIGHKFIFSLKDYHGVEILRLMIYLSIISVGLVYVSYFKSQKGK